MLRVCNADASCVPCECQQLVNPNINTCGQNQAKAAAAGGAGNAGAARSLTCTTDQDSRTSR